MASSTGGTAGAGGPQQAPASRSCDVAVVGAGLMGSATAWAASRRGLEVAVLEQFRPGHTRGSSHGSARVVRRAYRDPLYLRMTGEALELWRELELASATPLLRTTGGIDHGRDRDPVGRAGFLREHGVVHELLGARAAGARWPGLRFAGPVLFHPEAGTVDADAAVHAFLAAARARGTVVHPDTGVLAVEPRAGGVRLRTTTGELTARCVVVAAGAWVADLVGGLVPLPAFTVTQQQVFHLPRAGLADDVPVVVHGDGPGTYSLPGGRDGGPGNARKVAEQRSDTVTTARGRDARVDPRVRQRIVDHVRHWMPGLDPTPFAEATCLYTSTATDDFVLDRHGDVVVCSPCSGHGAKFAPLVGELATDLVLGRPVRDHRFTLAAHRPGGVGPGSAEVGLRF